MTEVILTSIVSFAGTNIDDIFVLMVLFAQAERRQERAKIAAGQYLGIGLLTLLSIAGARGFQAVLADSIWMLGTVPVFMGVRFWVKERRERKNGDKEMVSASAISIPAAFLLTVTNGADNIGVYIPQFGQYSPAQLAVCAAVFMVMAGIWCLLGNRLAGLPLIRRKIQQYRHILVPLVLIGLGVMILRG